MSVSVTVGTQTVQFTPPWDCSLMNMGSNTVFIDTVVPNPATSLGINPSGAVTLSGGKRYFMAALAGTNRLVATEGVTGVVGSVGINGSVPVQNVSNGVLSTFVKSPPALNSIAINTNYVGASSAYGGGASGAGSLNSPSSLAVGNLVLGSVIVLFSSAAGQQVNFTFTPSVPSIFGGTKSLSFAPSTTGNCYACQLFWGTYSGTGGLGYVSVTASGAGNTGFQDVYGESLCVGSGGNNAFSNPTLSGLLSDTITWSASGTSDPNMVLPSSSPGLFVGQAVLTNVNPQFSVGASYVENTVSLLWIASNQTGEFGVQTSANPNASSANVFGQTGIVIPQ